MVDITILYDKLKYANAQTSFTLGEIEELRLAFYHFEKEYLQEHINKTRRRNRILFKEVLK